MTKEQYEHLSAPFRTPGRTKALLAVNTAIPLVCYVTYPLCLLTLIFRGDLRWMPVLLVPGVSFAIVSLFRSLWNRSRPYEVLDIQPLIHKNTRGKSFPSRHVFSVFVIAMTLLWLLPPVGICFLLAGVVLALCRVVGGVHFPRDVVAGALLGILSGVMGYWLMSWPVYL
ncbi:MAG: phosphatase PAP2 family protein [Clostridiales bacterium]|nr:phosphatase PAP2 family protein [Clostridiales bacterium]